MTYILCIETATDICSVAIAKDGECFALSELPEGNRHSEGLTNLIKEVCDKAKITLQEISAVAISDGPGSYTGLRVGSSTAKAICYSLDVPMIAIPSLHAIAQGIQTNNDMRSVDTWIMPTIDARRMEVYAAMYNTKLDLVKATYSLIYDQDSIDELRLSDQQIIIGGNGAQKLIDSDLDTSGLTISPSSCNASDICPLAHIKYELQEWSDLAYHTPYYHKSPNITKPKPKV